MLHICEFICRQLYSCFLSVSKSCFGYCASISLEVACNNECFCFVFVCVCLCVLCVFHCHPPALYGINVNANSLRSFSSDRSNTLNRSSFARDSMMIEEILAPNKDTVRPLSPWVLRFCVALLLSVESLYHVEVHNLWIWTIKSTWTIMFSSPYKLSKLDSKLDTNFFKKIQFLC